MLPTRNTIGDVLDDIFEGLGYFSPQNNSYPFHTRGQIVKFPMTEIVDTNRYDIVPKKSFVEGEIKRKEEELRRFVEIHKITLKQKQDEIDSLRSKLTNK